MLITGTTSLFSNINENTKYRDILFAFTSITLWYHATLLYIHIQRGCGQSNISIPYSENHISASSQGAVRMRMSAERIFGVRRNITQRGPPDPYTPLTSVMSGYDVREKWGWHHVDPFTKVIYDSAMSALRKSWEGPNGAGVGLYHGSLGVGLCPM